MTYEEFKREFKKVVHENAKSSTTDLLETMAESAWMAFGRLENKKEYDEWGRPVKNYQ